MRVGDYTLDNTHPMRGDAGGRVPAAARVSLPLTDDRRADPAGAVAGDGSRFKQATEALTRVRTNVAAKVKEENPAPDFSREEPQVLHRRRRPSYTMDTGAWEARLRRVSAPFGEDPLIFDGDVSLSVEADNRYYTNSEGSQLATGELSCRIFIQAATKADDGMELPLYTSYFARTATACRTRSSCSPTCAR